MSSGVSLSRWDLAPSKPLDTFLHVQIREITAQTSGVVLQIKGDSMCLALGNNQQLNIIIYESLFTGDGQMSGVLFVYLFICLFEVVVLFL